MYVPHAAIIHGMGAHGGTLHVSVYTAHIRKRPDCFDMSSKASRYGESACGFWAHALGSSLHLKHMVKTLYRDIKQIMHTQAQD